MKKTILVLGVLLFLLLSLFVLSQWFYLRKAHSSFENYYAFRGCQKLIQKTDTFATCKMASGETIKIVKYNNKWYLDGDLPWACVGKICFGW